MLKGCSLRWTFCRPSIATLLSNRELFSPISFSSRIHSYSNVHLGVSRTESKKMKGTMRSRTTAEGSDHHKAAIELNFPFRGTLSKCDTFDRSKLLPETKFTVHQHNCGSDAQRKYMISCSDEMLHFPSVTTVLSCTVPKKRKFMLSMWKKGIVREYGEDGYHQIRDEIKALGNKFHLELESLLYKPHVLSIKPVKHSTNKATTTSMKTNISLIPPPLPYPPNHNVKNMENEVASSVECDEMTESTVDIAESLDGEDDVETQRNTKETGKSNGYLESVKPVLADISEVYALESVVAHLDLGYSGTCDCIASYRGDLCLIDWKTSTKPRPLMSDLHDYPLQAVAYAGAVNQDPHYPFKVENVAIVIAYPSGDPCHVHLLPAELCEQYWEQWLQRLLHYQTLFSLDLSEIII